MSDLKSYSQEMEQRSPQEIATDAYIAKRKHDLEYGQLKALGREDEMLNYKEVDEKYKDEIEQAQQNGADFKQAKDESREAVRPWVVTKVQEVELTYQKNLKSVF